MEERRRVIGRCKQGKGGGVRVTIIHHSREPLKQATNSPTDDQTREASTSSRNTFLDAERGERPALTGYASAAGPVAGQAR